MRQNDGTSHIDAAQATAADSGVKAMVPVGRPFLDYVLSALADAGFKQACLVIGPEHGCYPRLLHARTAALRGLKSSFAAQTRTTGHRERCPGDRRVRWTQTSFSSSTATTTTRWMCCKRCSASANPAPSSSRLRRSSVTATSRKIASVPLPRASSIRDGFLADIVEKPACRTFRRRQTRQHELLALRARDLFRLSRCAAFAARRIRAASRRKARRPTGHETEGLDQPFRRARPRSPVRHRCRR